MRTIEKRVFTFDELSDEAREKALQNYAQDGEYFWSDDVMNSIKKGLLHFGYALKNWDIDFSNVNQSSWRVDAPDEDVEDEECFDVDVENMGSYDPETLKGYGDCKFTGVCFDEDFADGVRKEWKDGERNIRELMNAGVYSCLHAAQKDYEHQYSEEGYAEHCEANGYEFYEDGSMF